MLSNILPRFKTCSYSLPVTELCNYMGDTVMQITQPNLRKGDDSMARHKKGRGRKGRK